MFRCENGPCIMNSLRCDGRVDCPFDDSDELDCRKFYFELMTLAKTLMRVDIKLAATAFNTHTDLNFKLLSLLQFLKEK